MNNLEERRESIRAFIQGFVSGGQLKDDEDIFAGGFVNSLFAMELVTFVETTFGVTIENEDLDIENFNTVDHLCALVDRKLTGDRTAAV